MSKSPENTSLVDCVRDFTQQAFDNQIDLTVKSNRESMIKQFKEAYPNENPKTISTLFGKEIPKIATSYNIDSEAVRQKPAKKFTKSNDISINPVEKKSGMKPVGIQNPAILNNNQKTGIIGIGQEPQYKYEIKNTQISAFGNALFGMFQVFSEDLEDFTESESADIGDLWQPVAQSKIGNSDKGQTVLAVGGTLGILARKAKKAKENRKVRRKKEIAEKGSEIEPKGD